MNIRKRTHALVGRAEQASTQQGAKRSKKSSKQDALPSIYTGDGKLVLLSSGSLLEASGMVSNSINDVAIPLVSSSECSEEEEKKMRGKYKCSRCGASKSGHVCLLETNSVMVCSIGTQVGGGGQLGERREDVGEVLVSGDGTFVEGVKVLACTGGKKTVDS